MCSQIDLPNALTFIVYQAANIQEDADKSGGYSPWVMTLSSHWDSSDPHGRSLSSDSRLRLQELWQASGSSKHIQWTAFSLWRVGIEPEDLAVLQSIPADSVNFTMAVMTRAKHGDHTVIPDIIPLLTKRASWFAYGAKIWSPELSKVVERYLAAFADDIPTDYSGGLKDSHYALSKYLTHIPSEDAEILLEKYWIHLGHSPMFVQSALFIGTTKCLGLAARSINQCQNLALVFSHIGLHWESTFGGGKPLQLRHFTNLEPYLDCMEEKDVSSLAQTCHRARFFEWGRAFLQPRLDGAHRKRMFPTDEDIRQELDELASDAFGNGTFRVVHRLEDWIPEQHLHQNVFQVIDQWLSENPGVRQYEIAAACIQSFGSRKDLNILEIHAISGDAKKVGIIRKGAEFITRRRLLE